MNKISKISKIVVAMAMMLSGGLALSDVMTGTVRAEEGQTSTLTVTPMDQRVILVPGESWSGSIKVSNPNDSEIDLDFSVEVGSFTHTQSDKDDYGATDVTTTTASNEIMKWITLGVTSGTLAPNESEVVPFTIDVPADAPAGGQYATIIVKNDTHNNQMASGGVQIQSNVQIASIIYAQVTGDTKSEGQVLDNSVPGFLLSSPIIVSSMVENSGNVHGDAKYTLQVWPMGSDEEICTNEEDPSMAIVLPNTKRYFTQTCDVAPVGIYKVKQVVELFGQVSTVERTVVLCPIWLLFVIVAVVLLIIFYIVKKVRDSKKPKRK